MLANFLGISYCYNNSAQAVSFPRITSQTNTTYIQLGTGGNVTTATTTALTTPVATKANSQSGSATNPCKRAIQNKLYGNMERGRTNSTNYN